MANKTDEMVIALFNKAKEKQREIERLERPKYITSCTVGYDPDRVDTRINLQTVTDISKLVDMYAFLLAKANSVFLALSELKKLDKSYISRDYKWMGYKISDWTKDIESRIGQIEVNAKKKELKELETRLDGLLSTEQRRELELAEIAKSLE